MFLGIVELVVGEGVVGEGGVGEWWYWSFLLVFSL